MAVISSANYLSIATQYDIARENTLRAVCVLLDAVQVIVDLTGPNAIIHEVDLLNTFYGVYLTMSDTWSATAAMLPSVRSINNHIFNNTSGVSDLDEYAIAEGITYPFFWADLCSNAGFSISAEYIDAAPSDYPFC